MAGRYASKTSVSVDRSKAEIERTLKRYGADRFAYGTEDERATICFRLGGRLVRFTLRLPPQTDKAFTHTPSGKPRTPAAALKEWEQGCRSSWRSLCLIIRAKLEAIESGIVSFDEEFLAHILLPDGETAGSEIIPKIAVAYETGISPPLLPYSP